MTRADVAAYARLFFRVFRDAEARPTPAFEDYLARCLFDNPAYDPAYGSMVQEDAEGQLVAVMGFIPVPLIACGREITARLGSAFLAEPGAGPGAAGRITALLRAKRQDFIFSNNGAQVTAESTRVGGGQVLPLQSLDWHRAFRPLANFLSARLAPPSKRPSPLAGVARALAAPFDALLRRLWPALNTPPAPGVVVEAVTRETILEQAPAMVAHFAVRPRWQREELGWLLDMAAMKQANGPLQLVGLSDAKGARLGLALYYARPAGVVEVLNILAQPGQENVVVQALLHHLDKAGHCSVRGEAQPFLMSALYRDSRISLRFRGNFCVLTRHADVADAVARGDFYAGGLVGESWSRLVTDFW